MLSISTMLAALPTTATTTCGCAGSAGGGGKLLFFAFSTATHSVFPSLELPLMDLYCHRRPQGGPQSAPRAHSPSPAPQIGLIIPSPIPTREEAGLNCILPMRPQNPGQTEKSSPDFHRTGRTRVPCNPASLPRPLPCAFMNVAWCISCSKSH